jgi:hypothetical protein
MDDSVKGTGLTTEYSTAIVVIGSLLFLILIRRGFRGVNVGGFSASVR